MTSRLAPPSPDLFTSRLRSPAVAARIGVWLGIAFGTCFLTGLVSHYAQLPTHPIPFPTSPSWGYRLTQGLHVTSGIAAIPLLLVKLWSVLPNLFESLPLHDARRLLLTGLERASIAVLVASSIFQLATGVANAAQWYPWSSFSFRTTHYAIAWVAIGALVLHIAVKLPIIRDVLTSDIDADSHDRASATTPGALSRRALVRTTFAAAAVTALATAGSTVPWLRRVSVLAVRTGDGPAGVPINKSARAARVEESAMSPDWRLEVVVGGTVAASLSYDDLRAMPQHTVDLPIACVEGWSAQGTWSGVRLADVLGSAGATGDRRRGGHLAPGVRALPAYDPPGELRRRRPHAPRPRPVGRAAGPRPRLPVPADRPRPARGPADQVGRPARGVGMTTRLAIGAVGVVVALYGAVLFLTRQDPGQWLEVGIWFAAGVALHDAVLSALLIGVGLLGTRVLPAAWRAPATIALVVWGSLTIATVPMLTRAGARADNATLLDRPYAATWWTISAIVVLLVAVAGLIRSRRPRTEG